MSRVAIVAGMRTPFVKSGKAFKELGPLKLARESVRGLIETHDVDPESIEALVYGVVVAEPGKPNLAREIVFEEKLPSEMDAHTLSSYCITGLRTLASVADVDRGRVASSAASRAVSTRCPTRTRARSTSRPRALSMGEHTELTRKEWDVPRDRDRTR